MSLIITVLVPLVFGFALLYLALRGRRVGHEPFCRKCGYNLTGAVGDLCSECGQPIKPSSVVYGVRKRRPVLAAFGVGILLMACLLGSGLLSKIEWYHYFPTSIVLNDLGSTDAATAQRAWDELQRRRKAGQLTLSHREKLIDICLADQASTNPSPLHGKLLEHLAACYMKRSFTPAQQEIFFSQLIDLRIEARPRVVKGDPLPVRATLTFRSKRLPFRLILKTKQLRVNEQPIEGKIQAAWKGWFGDYPLTLGGIPLAYEHPGKATLDAELTVKLHDWTPKPREGMAYSRNVEQRESEWGIPIYEGTFDLSARTEILATEPANYITYVNGPEADAAVLAGVGSVKVTMARTTTWDKASGSMKPVWGSSSFSCRTSSVGSKAQPMPAYVLGRVFALIGGKEYEAGRVWESQGDTTCSINVDISLPPDLEPGQDMDLIIRSDDDLARQTIDVFKAWSGEVVLRDVEVTWEEK
jgi:hypothetical protein